MRQYDVAIIGAGTAGLSARREVAKKTKNYVVIDDGPLGTTCARVGCMPSKVLLQVAKDFHRRTKFSEVGINGGEQLTIDRRQVMQHVRKLRDRFVRAVLGDMEAWTATNLLRKRARFIDAGTLDLGDEQIKAHRIIIAAGSRPVIPKAWENYRDFIVTTEDFFELETLPERVAVIGLGVIGVEIGQALQRLGVDLVGISQTKAIGGLTDPKLQDYFAAYLSQEMQLSFAGAEVIGRSGHRLKIKSGESIYEVDKVIMAVGREPNLAGLGLENLGITLDKSGLPNFDPKTFQVRDQPLYLAGDVNRERPILHEAADQGRIAGFNSVAATPECFQRRLQLSITFADPNIAVVGKSFRALTEAGVDFVTGRVSYEGQGRAIVMLAEKGLVHIYADRHSGKLLGAEIIAPEGEHLAHLVAWAMAADMDVFKALSMPFYHPVLEEGLRTALRDITSQLDTAASNLELLRCESPPAGA